MGTVQHADTVAAASETAPLSTRSSILDAAEHLFAERGFAGTAMRDVAAAAGLRNQASVYHYFRDKRRLYEAVLTRAVAGLAPLWEDASRGPVAAAVTADAPIARDVAFAAGLDRIFTYLAERPDVARLIDRAGLEEDRLVRGVVAKQLRGLYASGLRALEATTSSWPHDELPQVAAGLYQVIFGYFANAALMRTVLDADPLSEAMLERQRRFVLEAMRRIVQPSAASPAHARSKETQ